MNLRGASPETPNKSLKYVVEESIFLAAVPLAFLLQISYPDVAQSISAADPPVQPPDQLRVVLQLMNIMYCSDADGTRRLTASIEPPEMSSYVSQDSRIQRWITASVFVAVVKVQETFFGDFTKGDTDHLYTMTSEFLSSIETPMDMWPSNVNGFWDFWDNQIDSLSATEEARMLANQVLYPSNAPLWARLTLLPLLRVWVTYWVSSRQRECFGLRATVLNYLAYRLSVVLVSVIYPLLPLSTRYYSRSYVPEVRYAGRKSKVERSFMVRYDE